MIINIYSTFTSARQSIKNLMKCFEYIHSCYSDLREETYAEKEILYVYMSLEDVDPLAFLAVFIIDSCLL